MISRLVIWCALALSAGLGLYGIRPPAALGPDTPLDQFSAVRATAHLQNFAARPRPIGSEENERTRAYLVNALRSLGAEVRVEQATVLQTRGGVARERVAQNIVALLSGTANRRAVMLVAHYDSVPAGPGAADDGAGLISILETLRALRAGPPLQNDLLILLSDGEEAGLLGSAAYVAAHPDLARRVGVALNLEARGSSGPVLMFETSEQNGWLIPELARAAPYPIASSLMYAVYRLMPNDTDLTELKKTGIGAFNFAFTESASNYHTARDTVENLDPRSVQQMGMNTLALARHFGNLPLREIRKPDCIYFNWLGQRLLLFYPPGVAWFLAIAAFVLLGLALVRRRELGTARSRVVSLGSFLLLLLGTGGGLLLVWSLLGFAVGNSLGQADSNGNLLLFVAFAGLGFVIGLCMLRWLSDRLGVEALFSGLLLSIALLSVALLVWLPGASYVLQWPALLGASALLIGRLARTPRARAGWGLLAALPVILLVAPLAYLFFVNLGLNFASLGATAFLVSLLLASGWPTFDFLVRSEPDARA